MLKAALTKAEISTNLCYKYLEGIFTQCQYSKIIVADAFCVLYDGAYALSSHEPWTKFTILNRNFS